MAKRPPGQLDLFGKPAQAEGPADRPWSDEIESLARGLSPLVHLGTSSWTFPGWSGLCYPPGTSDARLLQEGLRLYTRFPLFRTVGIDRSYYRPIPREELAAYAAQLPAGFPCVEKVWDHLVTPVFPPHPRYGPAAGQQNPGFLDPELFREAVWKEHEGVFEAHVACFVLEFPPMPPGARPPPTVFAERLARFLDAAPKAARFAVELRNEELLTEQYLRVLRDWNVAHVYNMWERMPMPGVQRRRAPPTADFVVSRLLLRPGTHYAERKDAFAPFDRIVDPNEEMHRDLVELAEEAVLDQRRTFIVVNNKAEGSSPLTIIALARRLQRS